MFRVRKDYTIEGLSAPLIRRPPPKRRPTKNDARVSETSMAP